MPERRERGAAAVEMAFMMIFLLVLVSGIVDIGRAIFNNISVQEAAQEGAHFAAFEESVSIAQIQQRAVDSTSSPALEAANVAVNCVTVAKSEQNGSRVSVTVTHDLELITPFVGQWFGGSIALTKQAEAERFYATCPT